MNEPSGNLQPGCGLLYGAALPVKLYGLKALFLVGGGVVQPTAFAYRPHRSSGVQVLDDGVDHDAEALGRGLYGVALPVELGNVPGFRFVPAEPVDFGSAPQDSGFVDDAAHHAPGNPQHLSGLFQSVAVLVFHDDAFAEGLIRQSALGNRQVSGQFMDVLPGDAVALGDGLEGCSGLPLFPDGGVVRRGQFRDLNGSRSWAGVVAVNRMGLPAVAVCGIGPGWSPGFP